MRDNTRKFVLLLSVIGGLAFLWAEFRDQAPTAGAGKPAIEGTQPVVEAPGDIEAGNDESPPAGQNDEPAITSTGLSRVSGRAIDAQSNSPVVDFTISLFAERNLATSNTPDASAMFHEPSGNFVIDDVET
jgi:hypothetical protein